MSPPVAATAMLYLKRGLIVWPNECRPCHDHCNAHFSFLAVAAEKCPPLRRRFDDYHAPPPLTVPCSPRIGGVRTRANIRYFCRFPRYSTCHRHIDARRRRRRHFLDEIINTHWLQDRRAADWPLDRKRRSRFSPHINIFEVKDTSYAICTLRDGKTQRPMGGLAAAISTLDNSSPSIFQMSPHARRSCQQLAL